MKLIYYTLYKWLSGSEAILTPQYTAACFLAVMLSLNVTAVFMLKQIPTNEYSKVSGTAVSLLIFSLCLCIVLFSYVRNDKYLKIAEGLDNNNEKK